MNSSERGIIMEKEGKRVIVLTSGGEWRELYLKGSLPEIGEEIMLPPEKKQKRRTFMVAAAVMMLLVLSFPFARQAVFMPAPESIAYYVEVDINPSIQLAVDAQERVISARGLNEDGEDLLTSIVLKGEKLQQAIRIFALEAIGRGYVGAQEPGSVMIAVIPAAGGTPEYMEEADTIGKILNEKTREIFQQAGVQAAVATITVEPDIHRSAGEAGLSAGKYVVLLEALAEGLPVTADELRRESISKVLKKYAGNTEDFLQKLKTEKNLLQKEKSLEDTLKHTLDKQPAAAERKPDAREEQVIPDEEKEQGGKPEIPPGQQKKLTEKSPSETDVEETLNNENNEGANAVKGNKGKGPSKE